jgi:hypothetical protein
MEKKWLFHEKRNLKHEWKNYEYDGQVESFPSTPERRK